MSSRPGPWAPAGTTMRLALLVALTVTTAGVLHTVLLLFFTGEKAAYLRCADQVTEHSEAFATADLVSVGSPDFARPVHTCPEAVSAESVAWLGGGLAALILTTALLYRLQPWWRIRRSGLVDLATTAEPALLAELDRLVDAARLRSRPRFLVDVVNPHAGGLAFGSGRRPLVCLDAGLVTLFRNDPVAFRVVVVHELAHHRNRDVPVTYAALAVWRAFLACAVAPYLVAGALFTGSVITGWTVAWNAGLIGLVYLTRNAVLRAREHHADVAVSRMTDSADPADCLPAAPTAGRRRLPAPLRKHPTPAARAAVVARPAMLLRAGFWEYVAIGAALQAGVVQLGTVMLYFGFEIGLPALLTGLWGTGAAVALCLAAYRAHAFRAAGGPGHRLLVMPGAGLAVGVGIGHHVGPFGSGMPEPFTVATVLLLTTAFVLLGEWARAAWTAATGSRTALARTAGALAVVGTLIMVAVDVLGTAVVPSAQAEALAVTFREASGPLRMLVEEAGWTALDEPLLRGVWTPLILLGTTVSAFGLIGLVLLWAVPLVWERRRGDRTVLAVALAGVPVWMVFSLLVRAQLRGDVPFAERNSEAFRLVLNAWEISGALAVQVAVCTVVAARGPLSPVRTLFGGAVGGLGCALALWAYFLVDACVPFLQAAKTTCPMPLDSYGATVLEMLLIGGLAAAVCGHLAGAAFTLLRRRAALPRPGHRLGPGRAAAVAAAVCVGVLVVPTASPTGDGALERAAGEARSRAPDRPGALRHWIETEGGALARRLTASLRNVPQSVRTEADVRALEIALERTLDAVDDVRAEPGPPGAEAHALWSEFLTAFREAVRVQLTALRSGDAALVEQGAQRLERAMQKLERLRAMAA